MEAEIEAAGLIELFYSGQSLSLWEGRLVNPSKQPTLFSQICVHNQRILLLRLCLNRFSIAFIDTRNKKLHRIHLGR